MNQRVRFVLAATCAAAVSSASAARANGRYPAADLLVFDPDDRDHLLVRTTFGLLESYDRGQSFSYVCEQALELSEGEDPMLAIAEGSIRVAATHSGLFTSHDGCDYSELPALRDAFIADLALDWGEPRRLLSLVVERHEDNTFTSRLMASDDSGGAFENVGEPLPADVLPLSLDVSPVDPGRVYVSIRLGFDDMYRSAVLHSRDGGRSFERTTLPGTENGRLAFIGAVHPSDADRLYVRVNSTPNTLLLTSDDGARSFNEIFAGTGKLLGFAIAPDGASIAFGGPLDGIVLAAADGAGAMRRSDVAPTCLAWRDDGLYACVDAATGASLGRLSHDASEFAPLLRFAELEGPTACAAGTFVGSVCPSAWQALVPRLAEAGAAGEGAGGAGLAGAASDGGAIEARARLRPAGGCSCVMPRHETGLGAWFSVPLILYVGARSRRRACARAAHRSVTLCRSTTRGYRSRVTVTRSFVFGFCSIVLVAGCGSSKDPFSNVGKGTAGTSAGTSGASSNGASGGSAGSGGGSAGASGAGAGAGATAGSGNLAGEGGSTGAAGSGNAAGSGGEPTAGSGGNAGSAGDASGGASGSGAAGSAGSAGAIPSDPPPGEYGDRATLPELNSEMAVAEAAGKIYVLGGYPSSREYQATVQVYDPATDTWDLAPPLPVPIHHPVAAGVGGKLYSLGGQTDGGDIARTLVYDPATNGPWEDLAQMPTARGAGAAAVIDDKIYVVGGRPPAGNAFEVYDVSEDAWTELEPLPDDFPERNHLAAAAIHGKIYVAGGRYGGGSFSDPMTDSLDIFDPATGEWSLGAPMLRPRGGVNGVLAYGCFHVWGGEGPNTGEPNDVFPDHDVYDPVADEWMELPDLPTPIHGVTGAVFLGGLIYMPGGGTSQGGSSGSNLFQVYHPVTRCE